MAGSSKTMWSDAESAFILNHADACLKRNDSYNDTVTQRLSEFAGRQSRPSSEESSATARRRAKNSSNKEPNVLTFDPSQ